MTTYAAGIQYDGFAYFGWQTQKHVVSVQQKVEEALSKIANKPITVFCSGRTDTGVHAKEQVIHFDCSATRSEYAWRMGGNTKLPDDIRIMWCHEVEDSFHARFSAIARSYRYVIYNAKAESALLKNRVNWVSFKLNEEHMHLAAQTLLGENDFTSFRASSCQSNTPFRNIHAISVSRENDFVCIDITANAFLHHMVRNIAGSLIDVGKGNKTIAWVKDVLQQKDRSKAGVTALANGLYFMNAHYPKKYQLKQINHNQNIII